MTLSYAQRGSNIVVLDGVQRTAALLLSMGKPLAGRMLKHFDETELREITRAVAKLGSINRDSLEELVDEFAESFKSGIDLQGGVGQVEELLSEALPPDQAANIMSDVFGSSNSGVWGKIASMPEARLAAYLESEHPQVATFVLSKLESGVTAVILSKMSRVRRNDIVMRMITIKPPTDQAMIAVESAMAKDLLGSAPQQGEGDTRSRVADIVNKMEPDEVEDVLRNLQEQMPSDAAALKKMLFTFDDLARLSVRARSTLFDVLSTEVIVLCLRGTEADFRENVLSAMASRSRRLVESELANSSSAQPAEIAKARRTVVDAVLRLAQRNEIEIAPPNDETAE